MGKIEPFVGLAQIPLNFICPECGETKLEEVMMGVTVLNSITAIFYNEDGVSLEWGDADYQDGHIARFQCEECGYMLEEDNGNLIRNYEKLAEWLKERNVPCESCDGLGFFASDREGGRSGKPWIEIERCDECSGERDDNWATHKAHIMAKGCVKLLEEAEFVLSMYDGESEEALSSAVGVQLRGAIETVKKQMEEVDATGKD